MGRTTTKALDRASPMPLWAQLQTELARRISSGAFDTSFPGEHDLVREYGVSRHTVREALRHLRQDGVIDASRGRGTWVRQTVIEQPLGSLYSLYRETQARGMTSTSTVLAHELVVDAAVAAKFSLPPDAPLFYLERLRYADNEPLAHDRIWMPGELATPLMDADFSTGAFYDQLVSRCGVRLAGGTERITAVVPSPEERSQLGITRGTACLAVERTGCLRHKPVEYRLALVRADRFSVIAEWSPDGYQVGAGQPQTTTRGAQPSGGADQRR